jgi:hypothetical protein
MQLKFRFTALLTLLLFIGGCRNHDDTSRTESFPEGFEAFYTRFHTDSLFQMNHILFPLEGKNSSLETEETKFWGKGNWVLHGEFDESLTDFNRSYRIFKGIIIEIIQDKYAFSTMERRFAQIDGEWMLIYYAITTSDQ